MSRILCTFGLVLLCTATPATAQSKSYRLPSVDIKERIIWGATCDGPDGIGLSFGGQDQDSETGSPHTRIKVNGEWISLHDELWRDHPLTPSHRLLSELAGDVRGEMVMLRAAFLSGKLTDEAAIAITRDRWLRTLAALAQATQAHHDRQSTQWSGQHKASMVRVIAGLKELAAGKLPPHHPAAPADLAPWPALIAQLHRTHIALEQLAELLAPQPAARALSPIVYDSKTKCFILFAGDHLDYLTNDTWLFDPATRRWSLRVPAAAPAARANHKLEAKGDGTIVLTGGYLYTSNTEYTGGQYRDHNDGSWTYDIVANTWTPADPAAAKGVSPMSRSYRTGALHTDFFLRGAAPDMKAASEKLRDLPVNVWVSLKPPHLPEMNRDWGTAVLDPDRDLILRFSGGHSAHGGTDVLHYHINTNRWELPFPVEFPLGQTYTNTEYPRGFNFNRRPWVTGHTYQSYGYDPASQTMLFTGERNFTYTWDPDTADWTGRFAKPKGMTYGDCFYTLTLCTTKHGLITWTQNGELFLFDPDHREWSRLALTGEKLPGSSVDNSTLLYDSKRDRLLFFRKPYGDKVKYDGTIHAVDWATQNVSKVEVKNAAAGSTISYLCQIRYDEANDVLLVGATLPPEADGLRRTPIFDCAKSEWQSAKITGDDPNGKNGRNVSLGLMYDAKRKLFWAVDTKSNVFVLRFKPSEAEMRAME